MRNNKKVLAGLLATAGIGLSLFATTPAIAAGPTAQIAGEIGENLNDGSGYNGTHMRYVGDPAPSGFADWYQWGDQHILTTSPEDGPISMTGTIDVTEMAVAGRAGIIGFHDAESLQAMDRGEKAEAGIYLAYVGGEYRVGVTDGAVGAEFVQRFVDFAPGDLTDGILNVDFVVDGQASPSTCASDPADVATADGCMTLTVNGQTVTDSYGTIVPTDITVETEFEFGAYPGWYSAYDGDNDPAGADGVGAVYSLTVGPVILTAPRYVEDCMDGGWEAFEFKNQGGCVSSFKANENAGK